MDTLQEEKIDGGLQQGSSEERPQQMGLPENVSPEKYSNEEKKVYWNSVFTGDVRSVPLAVREKAGVPHPLSPEDDALLAGTVVRSWAADHLPVSKEMISSGWGDIRRGLARDLGTGEDDHEIFLALSERNKVQRQEQDQLSQIYAETYDRSLRADAESSSSERNWRNLLPERLHPMGGQMEERAASAARDDQARLEPVLQKLEKGIDSFMELESVDMPQKEDGSLEVGIKSYKNSRLDLRLLMTAPNIISAVNAVRELDVEDRKKVYGMLAIKKKQSGPLGERALMALNRGALDLVYNTANFGMNMYTLGVEALGKDGKRFASIPDDWAKGHGSNVRDALGIFEELKQYVRTDVAPLYEKGDRLAEQILLDGVSSAIPAALAFTGPVGLGFLAASDAGRQMADARQMNPDGDYNYQMGAATLSGVASSVLSLGMTKLGQKVVGGALKTFRSAKGASGISGSLRSLAGGGARMTGDLASMTAENKAQELVQYGAQEVAAELSGKESGVPWQGWVDRNIDPAAQAREAASVFPFLLIAAGKSSFRHFRKPDLLLKEGDGLARLGVPQEDISRIVSEPDLDVRTKLVRDAVRSQPLWGSLFLGRKAFEWARILENPEKPLFYSEEEVREFLDMGPERIEKPWEKAHLAELAKEYGAQPPDPEMNTSIARERWLMRAGIPQSKLGDELGAPLQLWESVERREERMALSRVNNRRVFIPEGLGEQEAFDPSADRARREFLATRLEEIGRRPYKALLLKYRDSDHLPSEVKDWDAVTTEASLMAKRLIAQGAEQISNGEPWDEVRNKMSSSWWSRWLGEQEQAGSSREERAGEWIRSSVESIPEDKRWVVPMSRDLVERMKSEGFVPMPKDLKGALPEMERYAADASDAFRESLPESFRALCRLSWGDQADARMLSYLIPNLNEFDVMASRGLTPEQSFGAVLKRHLGLEGIGQSLASQEKGTSSPHRWMKDVMDRLEKVTPRLMESTIGVDGKKLWRVRYPSGELSAWHSGKKEAWNDMSTHLSIVYSPVGVSRRAMIGDWRSAQGSEVVTNRIREGIDSLTLMDDLAVRATDDLVSQGYGRMSHRAPGDELVIYSGDDSVPLEQIMGGAGVESRKGIYEKYVGPAIDVAAEASNIDIENAKGMIINRLELYRKSSPLGMIEDRAEVVWDRLLRTGQLDVETAWKTLAALGRAKEKNPGEVYGDYVGLSEELSQLSKEWYLGHLDDPSVPSSAAMWVRYALARPLPTDAQIAKVKEKVAKAADSEAGAQGKNHQRYFDDWSDWSMTEEMRRLADSARFLPDKIRDKMESSDLPDRFIAMLSDSAGMNRHARMERFWALSQHPDKSVFPMMERYVHSLADGRLLEVLPAHVAQDLIPALARKNRIGGGREEDFISMEKEARASLLELAETLRVYPDIASWNPDSEMLWRYQVLQEKIYPSFGGRGSGRLSLREKKLEPAQVKVPVLIDHDWTVTVADSLPDSWLGDPAIARSIETLGLIRRDFASRPLPSNDGIYWMGNIIKHDSLFAPGGIPHSWDRDVPLGTGMSAILKLEQSGERPKGAHFPFVHNWNEAEGRFDHCVVYMDPMDNGHTIRLMPGMPEFALKEARAPYVVHSRDGIFLDVDGYPVRNYRDSYIPLERFRFLNPSWEMTLEERSAQKQATRNKLLSEISDPELQKKFWWDPRTGDGSFAESVIRLYEELGIRRDYERGKLKLSDPDFVESLRFVSHILNYPKWLVGGFEYGSDAHRMILEEGNAWKRMVTDKED